MSQPSIFPWQVRACALIADVYFNTLYSFMFYILPWVGRLSLNAKQDLKRIYAYGFAEYGELQADKYFEVFFHTFIKKS